VQGNAAERLLDQFVNDFSPENPETELWDEHSGMLLVGHRSSFRLGRRSYWEIVIAPEGGIASVPRAPDLEATPLVKTPGNGQDSQCAHSVEGVTASRDEPDQVPRRPF
jgi:hypothetical protein